MYVVLVPVKPPAIGKSRLAGVPDDERHALAAAFAWDTLAACRSAACVEAVLVVSDDAGFAAELTSTGVDAMPDGVSGDLNGALRLAAAEAQRRWPDLVPVALCADLPALRASELEDALVEVLPGEAAYVVDADGTGTTLYTAASDSFDPRFGAGSAAAHRDSGARPIVGALPGLRRDVDDLDDLRAALLLGAGRRTRQRAAPLLGDGPLAE